MTLLLQGAGLQIAASVAPADPGIALRADAMAYWTLDEKNESNDRIDYTGHGNTFHDGTLATVAGKIGGAVYNNTPGPYLYAIDDISTAVPGAQSFSITFWIYINSMTTDFSLLIQKTGFEQDIAYEIDIESGAFTFYIAGTDLSYPTVNSNALSVEQWYFVDAEFQAGTGLSLRVNNGAPITQAFTLDNIARGTPETDQVNACEIWTDGAITMDEMMFIKRVLTSDERDYLYNSGTGRALFPVP